MGSHRVMAKIRVFLKKAFGYDEVQRLKEAVTKMKKALNEGKIDQPTMKEDPHIYVGEQRARTVIGGAQPEPERVDVDQLQSIHDPAKAPHRMQSGANWRRMLAKGNLAGKGGKGVRREVRQGRQEARALARVLPRLLRRQRLTQAQRLWRLIRLHRLEGSQSWLETAKDGQVCSEGEGCR